MKAKLGPFEKKGLKPTDINQDEIFQKQPGTPFLTTKGLKNFRKS
jgi:hypothetical protein